MTRQPKNSIQAPAKTSRRLGRLHILVFKLGGVAGATRRIIRKQNGLFDRNNIYGELLTRYPELEPAPYQLQDIMENLECKRFIECVQFDDNGKVYKQAPHQLYFNF